MHVDYQNVFFGLELQQFCSDQWSPLKVKGHEGFALSMSLPLGHAFFLLDVSKIDYGQGKGDLGFDHLNYLSLLLDKSGPQRLMPAHNGT